MTYHIGFPVGHTRHVIEMTSDRAEFTEEQLLFVMMHTSNKIQSYKTVSFG